MLVIDEGQEQETLVLSDGVRKFVRDLFGKDDAEFNHCCSV